MNKHSYPIPSREEILGILRTSSSKQQVETIADQLGVKPEELDGMVRRLNAMERDGQVKQDKSGNYTLANQDNFISGRVSSHRDGYGFLTPEDGSEDLFLPEREMQRVLHGDRVTARVVGTDRRGRLEGGIIEILERANTHIIGRLLNENGVWIVAPEDKRFSQDILLAGSPGKAKSGQVVSVELTEQPTKYAQAVGRIVEVLGDVDDPGMEIEIAVRKFGVPHEFSESAKKAASKLPSEIRDADLVDRVDLRDIPLVTIDGEDARDFDDAVYCEAIKTGRSKGYRLIVAIADVSHYVKPNDALDQDALLRSTSVYFPRRVIPMLPEKLSNGLCSLNPDVDRLTLVCDMVISLDGEVTAYQFYPSVIHSSARFTYTEVAAILGNTKGPEANKRLTLVPHLLDLYDCFQALLKARHRRGAIDFETTETYIVCNAAGKIEKILPRTRNDAHKLIEECMLAANVCAANLLETYKQPGTYRIHAGPTKEKLTQVRNFLKQVGLNLTGGDKPSASDYAELMGKIKGRPDSSLLQTMLLRSMQQAVYSPDNIGHFGLSYDAYAHFTSPIRRYPDLLTHRAIKAILLGKKYEPKGIDTSLLNTTVSNAARKQQIIDKAAGKKPKAEQDLTIWDALGVHCSANERRADEASRDVEAWLKCYFIRNKLGEEFSGTISGVTQFGIFVQLDDIYIEGLVHITELGADYFQFDDARHELRGERTGKRYQLADKIKVQVSRVDLDARKIDLAIVPASGAAARIAPAADARGNSGATERAKAGKASVGKAGVKTNKASAKAPNKTAAKAASPAANSRSGKPATTERAPRAASRSGKKKR
ncbi:ribonuclease R [Undibacterium sp. RTI2.1]|uniref:ribonuclease R n=4 Tax=Undibacterium TaxID=401469 RepID=UPI002AB3D7B4|nr:MULTISPECIES: ribonuclease R [unclassified Undibacterium]MDY7538029.1 ribonuclease R [Undibacterium sp. 5I1]MEB0032345.1 ribonuclease R [Undibacterium sp. RTI2.1]MEB0117907.1 ribonuclease R [Undibacterium sp. RTI2.2]MEB0258695.1 ribonuclease R [Undibacterium sp. 5I1]